MSRPLVALTAGVLASLLLAGSIGAAGSKKPAVGFSAAPRHALPGDTVRVAVAVRPAGRTCTLRVTYASGARQAGLRPVRAAGGRARWEFRVPADAKAGTARLQVSCQRVGTATRALSIVGAIIPARISVEQTGFSVRPGRVAGATISYGVILKNLSPNQDAFALTVLVNLVDATNFVWASKTSAVAGIAAGAKYALGDFITLPTGGAPPITHLEVTVQIASRAPSSRRPATLASRPGIRNVRIMPDRDPAWVGLVDGEVVNDDPRLILERTRFSAVILDAGGAVIGGGYGATNISMPPGARSVFILNTGFTSIPMIQAASALISAEPAYRQPGS